MDLSKLIEDFRREKECLDRAIASLEELRDAKNEGPASHQEAPPKGNEPDGEAGSVE